MDVLEKLKNRLLDGFPDGIIDLSSDDNIHFRLRLIDSSFKGLSKLAQHRKVYEAIGDMMASECHALQIETDEESI